MKESIKFKSTSDHLAYKIVLILIGIFIPMLMLFLFGGEINLNHENWLVAVWGKKWGLLSDNTYGFGINPGPSIISWQPFVYSLVIFFVTSIFFFILLAFKKIDLLFFTIICSSWFVLFIILISGLLYPAPDGSEAWKILVRLLVIIASFVIIFFPVNAILNTIMAHSRGAESFVKTMIDKEIQAKEYIKDNIDIIKPKQKNKIKSIDVKE